MTSPVAPYDALLLCSFGGPNASEDVVPFLRNVVRGKGVPDERLTEVGEHYFAFGGKSPINEQNLALRAALSEELKRRGADLPVLWGNRNWHPYTADTLRDAHAFGARRILVLVTSAYASYSGSRQYREHLAAAVEELGAEGAELEIDIVRPFFNDPGFVEANTAAVLDAIGRLPEGEGVHVAYVTHSIPDTMQEASAVTGPGYREQHEDVQRVIDAELRERGLSVTSSLSYCSRSGDPRTPWLEPDVNDHLADLAAAGVTRVVIAPIGFISDHMEVAWDLDTEAMETAQELGLHAARAATAGVAPVFVEGLVDLVLERAFRERGEDPAVTVRGELGAFPDVAPPGSCRMRLGEVTGIPVLAGTVD
ncbi:ferrochelatase [Georgenia sp. H159]|uniref:ferrochelatase n=1 Tax=Georgenia sp. H159 TaxID=3076115 RepID=UPI002D774729|nr:ferrochelatase [Georgenia sp. H159]